MSAGAPLFRRILGARFDELPPPIQRLHAAPSGGTFSGRCDISAGASWPAKLLVRVAGLPGSAGDVPVDVGILYDATRETWTRRFDGTHMQSTLSERDGRLVEAIGPMQLGFDLEVAEGAIVWKTVHARALGVPLPLSWFRKVGARVAAQDGRYTFDVWVELPVVGLLIRYRGWLE